MKYLMKKFNLFLVRKNFIDRLDFKNPIMDILISFILGSIVFMLYDSIGISILMISSLIVIGFFIFYDKGCFIIVCMFFIVGMLCTFTYYSFSINREDTFTVRIDKSYKDYYMVSSKGRKFYLYSPIELTKDYKLKFKGKYKKESNIDKGIVGHLFVKDIIKNEEDFVCKIRKTSEKYYTYMSERISVKKAAIATALVFGDKEFIDKNDMNDFKNIGILHLICISGFHIVFIYSIVRKLFLKQICIPLTFTYVIFTGLTASGFRAFYMLVVLECAKSLKKNYNSMNALALASLMLLFVKPFYILDISFLLSVFATMGIFLFTDIFKRILYFLPNFINSSISLSLSAQVFIYPIMVITFKTFSMNFILGSLILTPYIFIALPFGILTFFIFSLGLNFSYINFLSELIFSVFEVITNYLKFYALDSYYLSNYFAVIYCILLILFYLIYKKYLKFKFYKFSYILVLCLVLSQYSMFPKISIFNKDFNKAIIVHNGFKKIAYTNSKSNYFLDNLKKENSINDVENIKNDFEVVLSENIKLIIKPKIDDSFIMLRNNNYDIIDMLNRDENAILIKNRIYINERGN